MRRCRYFIKRLRCNAHISTAFRRVRRNCLRQRLSHSLVGWRRGLAKITKKLHLCDSIYHRKVAKKGLKNWIQCGVRRFDRVLHNFAALRGRWYVKLQKRVWLAWSASLRANVQSRAADTFFRTVIARHSYRWCFDRWNESVTRKKRLRVVRLRILGGYLRYYIDLWKDLVSDYSISDVSVYIECKNLCCAEYV